MRNVLNKPILKRVLAHMLILSLCVGASFSVPCMAMSLSTNDLSAHHSTMAHGDTRHQHSETHSTPPCQCQTDCQCSLLQAAVLPHLQVQTQAHSTHRLKMVKNGRVLSFIPSSLYRPPIVGFNRRSR